MLDVEGLAISRLVNLAPKQSFHVAIAKSSEAREEEGLLHYLIAAWCSHNLAEFLNGQELTHRTILLRFLFCIEQLERITVYQTFTNRFRQSSRQAVHEYSASGCAQGLLTIIKCAGLEVGNEPFAEGGCVKTGTSSFNVSTLQSIENELFCQWFNYLLRA